MTDADTLLQKALAAHRAGRLEEADNLYRQVLQRAPGEPMALYLLGLTCFHRGDAALAVEHISASLAARPANVRAWKDLGGILMASGRLEEARDAYRQAAEHGPLLAESWYNLGVSESRLGATLEAIAHLKHALVVGPSYTRSYEPLALLLYRSGDPAGATEVYQQWLLHEPGSPTARHMVAAAAGQGPPRAADDYIRTHFDLAADGFDSNLAQLGYRAPEAVAAALTHLGPAPLKRLLDAGCGTGLCGPQVRARCEHLTGVDLSAAMLAQAAQRGCYDELVQAELTAFLHISAATFDAVICVDTLVYFGDLEEPLRAAHAALKGPGPLVFTLEAGPSRVPKLEIHGRYSHSEAYVREALQGAGFAQASITEDSFRQERGRDVAGLLITAHRA
jgi:predicted TPR repeat methyltransferase